MNTQEKELELGEGVTSAEFWMYDGKLGRRWNVDPLPTISYSLYSCFLNNPIAISDPFGDTVIHKSWKDKIQSSLTRIFDKGFRIQYRTWKNSRHVFRIGFSRDAESNLSDAKAEFSHIIGREFTLTSLNTNAYDVKYKNGFVHYPLVQFTLEIGKIVGQIGWASIKIPVSIILSPVRWVWNVSSKDHKWHFGDALWIGFEWDDYNAITLFQYGIGDYNKYDLLGKPLLRPNRFFSNGFVSLRIGQGRNLPPMIFDIGPEIGFNYEWYLHVHLNLMKNSNRRRYYPGDWYIFDIRGRKKSKPPVHNISKSGGFW